MVGSLNRWVRPSRFPETSKVCYFCSQFGNAVTFSRHPIKLNGLGPDAVAAPVREVLKKV